MSFLGGALEKTDPAKRVEQALRNDLQARHKAVIEAGRFLGYHYRGSADMLLRHGRFYPGRRLPDQYEHLTGPPSWCFPNAFQAAIAEPTLRYCEGVYTAGWGSPRLHAWCLSPDDQVVEVTMPTHDIEQYTSVVNARFLPPERWGYFGIVFDPAVVEAHDSVGGLPMFDRSPGELSEQRSNPRLAGLDFSEPHDFPILKVKYDPNRKVLP